MFVERCNIKIGRFQPIIIYRTKRISAAEHQRLLLPVRSLFVLGVIRATGNMMALQVPMRLFSIMRRL